MAQNYIANAFQAYTGFQGLPSTYTIPSTNPLLATTILRTENQKRISAQNRANTITNRFNLTTITQDMYLKPYSAVVNAQQALTNAMTTYNMNFMVDENGYVAYQTVDKLNHTTYSTNLTRLRASLMKGMDVVVQRDEGPAIPGIPGQASADTMAIATNRIWTVLISWHKLLNASRTYNKGNYNNKSVTQAYNELLKRKADNLQNKFHYYAVNPNKLDEAIAKATDSVQGATMRAQARVDKLRGINNIIQGFIRAPANRPPPPSNVFSNLGNSPRPRVQVDNMAGGLESASIV